MPETSPAMTPSSGRASLMTPLLGGDPSVRLSVALVLAVALLASVTGLTNGFAYDDIPIIVENPMVQEFQGIWDYLTGTYWGQNRGNSLYRPITVIAFATERLIGGGAPWPFHVANVLLYALCSLAVLALLRQLLPKWGALVGALVFAAHPVHVEAVANVVGQSEMLTGLPMLIAMTVFLRDRQRGELRTASAVTIVVCQVIAVLSKEHGIVLPALLLLAEVMFRGTRFPTPDAGARRQLRMLVRLLVLTIAAYIVVRLSILSGFAGDAPHPALEGLKMTQRLWVMLALVPEFVRLLFWPAQLYADYSPPMVPVLTAPELRHAIGASWLLVLGSVAVWAWRKDRVIAFAFGWVVLTQGPTSNILIATGVLVAERTLFLPTVAVALVVGHLAVALRAWASVTLKPSVQKLIAAAGVAVLLAAVIESADRQQAWEDNATVFSTLVVDAPNNYKAQHALGELFGASASWERAEYHLRIADSLYPGYDLLELSLARVLHFEDRCPEALGYYDRVLKARADAEIAAIGRAACLLEVRRLSDAREAATNGLASGFSSGSFGLILQKAESSLVATDTVDARNRWYRAGAPFSKSDARLRVPVLLLKPPTSLAPRKVPESGAKTRGPAGRDP